MYAIVKLGSNQFKVSEGDFLEANRLEYQEGKSVTLDKVLFYTDGKVTHIGSPFLKEVKVTAKVVGHPLDDKKFTKKYRRRKSSASQMGHRQRLTALNIQKITVQ